MADTNTLQGKIFDVFIGERNRKFTFYQFRLVELSSYFNRACSDNAALTHLSLRSAGVAEFDVFWGFAVHWAIKLPEGSRWDMILAKCWFLSRFLEAEEFGKEVLRAFIHQRDQNSQLPRYDTILFIFRKERKAGATLRQLVIDILVREGGRKWYKQNANHVVIKHHPFINTYSEAAITAFDNRFPGSHHILPISMLTTIAIID